MTGPATATARGDLEITGPDGSVPRDGFTLIEGVPVRAGLVAEVAKVADCFGYVRETSYGQSFDNTRIRHGLTAFTGSGERLPRGCCADLDALASALAVREREGVAA